MIDCSDPTVIRAMLDMRSQKTQTEAQFGQRLRLVRPRKQKRPLWWARQMLYRLGQWLVVLGHQLERYGLPQTSL
jgi:hypothetical protein